MGLRLWAGALAGIAALLIAAFGWLGYLGGDPFVAMRPAAHAPRRAVAALVLSGDMGFKVGMGPQIIKRLVADGMPVIGINALNYFRVTRTPADATALIAEGMRRALALSHGGKLLLIGQSYGADMLHVGLAGLSAALRRRIMMVVLVVPGATVEYRASPGEIFTVLMHEDDAMPTARQLDWAPLLCINGQEEGSPLCPLLRQRNAHVVMMPGGHPLHYDADGLYRTLRTDMLRNGVLAPPKYPA